jgi:lysophospholipase L1-like esterase
MLPRPGARFRLHAIVTAIATVSSLAIAEAGLRTARFEYHLFPAVQFGWPDPVEIRNYYRPDPDLVWVTRDFAERISFARQTHPDVVFMGDSCTEFGTYPARTIEKLHQRESVVRTGVAFGVGGWSSEQGLTLLRRDILALKPRVVTIYFGWNDHWVALGPTDPELASVRRFQWASEHVRLMQLLLKARMGVSEPMSKRPNRVPIERYQANLESMVRETRAAGIRPVLITAPSNHVRGHEPPRLQLRHVRSLDEVVPLHTAYLEVTRRVASATGATLCDAAAAFGGLEPRDSYFQRDGIHLTPRGDEQLASLLANCIVDATR